MWYEKVLGAVDDFIEWHTYAGDGGISWRYDPDEGVLIIAPQAGEFIGGKLDGAKSCDTYNVYVSELLKLFDVGYDILWLTDTGTLSVEGTIGGVFACVRLSSSEFPDDGPSYTVDTKTGKIVRKCPKF
jgi:hypothetical protein